MRAIGVGHTTITDAEIPIQINVNLMEYSLDRYIEGVVVDQRKYDSLQELIKNELEGLDFDSLIDFSDEELAKVSIHHRDSLIADAFYSDDEHIVIKKYPNEAFYIHYGYDPKADTAASIAGPFATAEEAAEMLKKHRPMARREDESPVAEVLPPPAPKPKERTPAAILHPPLPTSQRHNFRIMDDTLGVGTPVPRYHNHVAALRLLKLPAAENRRPPHEATEALSKYVGWGGLSACFEEKHSKYQELKTLLTEEEYAAARESSLTAFYTPPVVIRAMFKAMENMGFKRGNVLEPSCGVGNFLGMFPDSMQESQLYGVELDSIAGRIAHQLYQNYDIEVQGFEKTGLPDRCLDAATGKGPLRQVQSPDKQ